MLTLKQSPFAIIGILLACSLADGEPEKGKLIIAFCVAALTFLYVLVCTYVNNKKYEQENEV